MLEVSRTSASLEGCAGVSQDDALATLIDDFLELGFHVGGVLTFYIGCHIDIFAVVFRLIKIIR